MIQCKIWNWTSVTAVISEACVGIKDSKLNISQIFEVKQLKIIVVYKTWTDYEHSSLY